MKKIILIISIIIVGTVLHAQSRSDVTNMFASKSLNAPNVNIDSVFKLTKGAGNGLFLTSDVYGRGSWAASAWSVTGNVGLTANNFLGSSDNTPFSIRQNNTTIFQGLTNTNIGIGSGMYQMDLVGSSNNFCIGTSSFQQSKTMFRNVGIGTGSFYAAESDSDCVAFGNYAGQGSKKVNRGFFLGHSSGYGASQNNDYVIIGYAAGQFSNNVNRGIIMGYNSGYSCTNMNDIIVIGNYAGSNNYNISNGLAIGNYTSLIANNSLNISNLIFATGTTSTSYSSPAGLVGIGTSTPQAALDVKSTTSGFLPPRMTTSQRNAISPIEGMLVYDLTLHKLYGYDGTAWQAAW